MSTVATSNHIQILTLELLSQRAGYFRGILVIRWACRGDNKQEREHDDGEKTHGFRNQGEEKGIAFLFESQ